MARFHLPKKGRPFWRPDVSSNTPRPPGGKRHAFCELTGSFTRSTPDADRRDNILTSQPEYIVSPYAQKAYSLHSESPAGTYPGRAGPKKNQKNLLCPAATRAGLTCGWYLCSGLTLSGVGAAGGGRGRTKSGRPGSRTRRSGSITMSRVTVPHKKSRTFELSVVINRVTYRL